MPATTATEHATAGVDAPGRARVADRAAAARISVVMPALDEAAHLPAAVTSALAAGPGIEVVVADGGSRDGTAATAAALGAAVVSVGGGRGRQMNAGARRAGGDLLVFLHADTRLPPGYAALVAGMLGRPGVVAGAFALRIDGAAGRLRIVERLVAWRSRRLQMPYGDQALFMHAATFRRAGGFPELAVMEDFELVRRLRRLGRIGIVAEPVVTSGRRWATEGVLRTTLTNQALIAGHLLGVSDRRLARLRKRRGGARCAPAKPAG